MVYKKTSLVLFTCCMLTNVFCQAPALQQLDSLAGKYMRALKSLGGEKIWLHTDRPVYRVGDIVFFKAFVTHALSGKPSRQSHMLFVDMVDEYDFPVNRAMLNASQFKTDGSFILPDTLASGHYWIRAYTKKSLQQKEAPMFVQAIYVINSLKPDSHDLSVKKNTTASISVADDSVRVQFFPEGGTMVGGANTLLAIKTTSQNGTPVPVAGFVKDNQDSVVARIQTDSNGLGKIQFFCWTWRTYQLHITRNNKPELRYTLPAVNLFGAQVAVIEKEGIRRLRVVLEDSIFRKDKISFVLGISGDSLCFSGVGRGSFDLVIPEYRFPKGIAHFILFDDQMNFLSERSVYMPGNETTITLTSDKQNYAAREKVNIALQVSDAEKKAQVASFMVEVNDITREAFYEPIKPVKTESVASVSMEQWDLFLLTQPTGYNRQVLPLLKQAASMFSETEEMDSSLYIQGKVLDERNRPLPKKIITLFGDTKSKLFTTDTTDANGRFQFPFTAYDDKIKFNLQVSDFSGRLVAAKIELDTLLRYPKLITPSVVKQRFVIEEIETVRKVMIIQSKSDTVLEKRGKEWLADVTVTGLVKKDPGYDVKKRQSLFSKIIPPEVLARMSGNSLGNAIFRVPGIHLRNGYVTLTGGNSFTIGAAAEPMLIVDGVPIPSDTSDKLSGSEPSPVLLALNRIDPSTVEFIEVLTGPEAAMYGVRGGNGVIIVNTRSRMLPDDANKINGIRNLVVNGFHVPENFEQRDYSVKEIRNTKIPDTRTLLFWNGDGITDNEGKATISFYAADAATTYTVTVTGITALGIRFQKQLQVSRK